MSEAASEARWAHTSALLALLANVHRDARKTRAYRPADFNPHMQKRPTVRAKVGIGVLKQVFVDNRR
jgi:hypothetical protein